MARKNGKSRIYRREDRGGGYYADLRAWSDVGGKREPLTPPGARSATTDRDVAEVLLAKRIKELEQARRSRTLTGIERTVELQPYAAEHLKRKARSGRFQPRWLQVAQTHLERACGYFGPDRELPSIDVGAVQKWTEHLKTLPNGRGGTLGLGTVRSHLNSLSNVFKRAQSEGVVPPGFNPVAAMLDKPTAERREAAWLEIDAAALLLESARRYRPDPTAAVLGPVHGEMMFPIVGTFLLTGGRKMEVLGLELRDISFDRRTVTFRPNQWRGTKTTSAARVVPMHPQLEEILRAYVFDRGSPLAEDGLLFPSRRTGRLIWDVDKALDAIGAQIGWAAAEIRCHLLRHTFTAHRLQTLDHGAPISPWTVSRELGHGGRALVDKIYGHLGQIRHRSEHLEYRIANHREVLADRLAALGWSA